jgi:DNA-binding transcriptional regulator YiaG
MAELLAELAMRRRLSEDTDAQAIEDGDAWTDEQIADADSVYPPPSPDQVRALRTKLGLTQAQFVRRFGFTLYTVQQYEESRRHPSGPPSTLLRVIEVDPDAVVRRPVVMRGRLSVAHSTAPAAIIPGDAARHRAGCGWPEKAGLRGRGRRTT